METGKGERVQAVRPGGANDFKIAAEGAGVDVAATSLPLPDGAEANPERRGNVHEAQAGTQPQAPKIAAKHSWPPGTGSSHGPTGPSWLRQRVRYAFRMETSTDDFGSLLRRLRKNAGLTLHDVADRCGVTFSAVGKWERGTVPVPLNQLDNLSAALGIDLRPKPTILTKEPGGVQELATLARELEPEQLAAVLALVQSLVKKK